MAEFPVSLDNLIAFVKAQTPSGGPLENLSDAIIVGGRLEEQGDALIGHFVDQARRSGASWSEIGASIGVSKQAAQKKFVFRWEDLQSPTSNGRFSRFTDRARNCVLAAHVAARSAGDTVVDVSHMLIGLTAEPKGFAAVIMRESGLTSERIILEFAPAIDEADGGTATIEASGADGPWLGITDAVRTVFKETLGAALHLGHNYIGTEHVLLGILAGPSQTADRLAELGLTTERATQVLTEQLTRLKKTL